GVSVHAADAVDRGDRVDLGVPVASGRHGGVGEVVLLPFVALAGVVGRDRVPLVLGVGVLGVLHDVDHQPVGGLGGAGDDVEALFDVLDALVDLGRPVDGLVRLGGLLLGGGRLLARLLL